MDRLVKLIIQIPCYNEASTLAQTIGDLPRRIDGVDIIETLIIDDGSTDGTAEIARELGVNHIIRHTNNLGLARSFQVGLDACLELGADIIVNTDGDNQYVGADVVKLLRPIINGRAEIVIGDRLTHQIAHFSRLKKLLQKLGSQVVRQLSNTDIPDVVCGFRALTRNAAMLLNITSHYSYTIEMVIQAGKKNIAITHVPIATNPATRESRLAGSTLGFVGQQLLSMIRIYAMYEPLRVFFSIGLALSVIGSLPFIRFLYFYFSGNGGGHIQSLVFGGVLLIIGFITLMFGLIAELTSFNRHLTEITLAKIKRIEHQLHSDTKSTALRSREKSR